MTKRDKRRWWTRIQMAEMFDLTAGGFQRSIQPHIPAEAIKQGEAKRLLFNGRAVIEAYASHRKPETTSDPELAGDGSPALERYRAARAEIAEYDLQIRRGDLMARADVHAGLTEAGAILRRKIARLRKAYGDDAAQIITDAVDDMLRANERLFGDNEDG